MFWRFAVIIFIVLPFVLGQEENLYAKKNYEKYLSALKDSGLVYMEDKAQGASSDVTVGAEGGAGAMVLLGRITFKQYIRHIFSLHVPTFIKNSV